MGDRRAAELRDVLDEVRAGHEVDRDCVLLTGHVERCGLAGDPHELLEVGASDAADVEARENGVGKPHDVDPEAVSPRLAVLLDETGRGEGAELARYGAGGKARASCELVRPDLPGVRERVEDRDRATRRLDPAARRLTTTRHGGWITVANGDTPLR